MHRHVLRLLAMSIAAVCLFAPSQAVADRSERFEVWLVDQSNSPGLTYGGRIYDSRVFIVNTAATVNLATCTTANGMPCQDAALRPDNAPICPVVDSTSSLGFVTLRGGGLFVVDPRECGSPIDI